MREVRKFAVDNVSHNPAMKLEYLALDNSVERLVRRVKKPKLKVGGKVLDKDKGKGKEIAIPAASTSSGFPAWADFALSNPAENVSSDEDGLNSDDDLSPGLKLETLEGARFYDVYGVRIFRKDVMAGRL